MLVMNDDLRCMKIIFNWMSRFCFLKQTRQRLFHSYVPVVRATSSLKKRTVLTIRCMHEKPGPRPRRYEAASTWDGPCRLVETLVTKRDRSHQQFGDVPSLRAEVNKLGKVHFKRIT